MHEMNSLTEFTDRTVFQAYRSEKFLDLVNSTEDVRREKLGRFNPPYAKFFSRSHDAGIRVYDQSGNVIETHEHKGGFKEWRVFIATGAPDVAKWQTQRT
jgi:hypothetical protein